MVTGRLALRFATVRFPAPERFPAFPFLPLAKIAAQPVRYSSVETEEK